MLNQLYQSLVKLPELKEIPDSEIEEFLSEIEPLMDKDANFLIDRIQRFIATTPKLTGKIEVSQMILVIYHAYSFELSNRPTIVDQNLGAITTTVGRLPELVNLNTENFI